MVARNSKSGEFRIGKGPDKALSAFVARVQPVTVMGRVSVKTLPSPSSLATVINSFMSSGVGGVRCVGHAILINIYLIVLSRSCNVPLAPIIENKR